MNQKRNTYLRGMTCVASGVPESEVNKILRHYKRVVPGPRASLQYQTKSGKSTLFIPALDAARLGLEQK
jgi:hypothetical protein